MASTTVSGVASEHLDLSAPTSSANLHGKAPVASGSASREQSAVGPSGVGDDGDGRASLMQQLVEHAQSQATTAQQLQDGGLQYSAPTDRASALFGPVVSLMNHSCHPNVDFRMVVRVPSASADPEAPARAVMLNSPD